MAMRWGVIAVIIVVIIIVAGGAAFFLTLQAPQVQGVKIRSIDNISRSGLTFTFSVVIYNPNIIGMTIKDVTYNLFLTERNQLLSNGTSDGAYIQARGSTEVFITSTVFFAPAISTAFLTIFNKSVIMNVNGVVTAHPLLIDVSVPFNQTFDAYPYIKNALPKA